MRDFFVCSRNGVGTISCFFNPSDALDLPYLGHDGIDLVFAERFEFHANAPCVLGTCNAQAVESQVFVFQDHQNAERQILAVVCFNGEVRCKWLRDVGTPVDRQVLPFWEILEARAIAFVNFDTDLRTSPRR